MGDVRETIVVPPQSGRAVTVPAGAVFAVVDLSGHQVGDLWAIDAADHGRWLSAAHTRDRCERLFPGVGEQFRDQFGEPILTLRADIRTERRVIIVLTSCAVDYSPLNNGQSGPLAIEVMN